MKVSVQGDATSLQISMAEVGDQQAALLQSLQACAEGRCSCPTPEYAKLQSIDVQPGADGIEVTLVAKPGEQIDRTAIDQCLDHTAAQLAPRAKR